MLAYRHAFHAGNHADVLSTLCSRACCATWPRRTNPSPDRHPRRRGRLLHRGPLRAEKASTAVALVASTTPPTCPRPLQDYVDQVRASPDGQLRQPRLARVGHAACCVPTDRLRRLRAAPHRPPHPRILLADRPHTQVSDRDGFESLKAELPRLGAAPRSPDRPALRDQTDYARVLAALRETRQRFADTVIMIWYPQLQLLESSQLVHASGPAPTPPPRRAGCTCDSP